MRTIKAFVDTSTVNRILEKDTKEVKGALYEEDRLYLSKIMEYVEKGSVQLVVNPSVKREIERTLDTHKKNQLLALLGQFHFLPYNKTIFPFTFPAYFITPDEKRDLAELCRKIKGFQRDARIFIEAVSSSQVEVLLTTDRAHLARKEILEYLKSKGLDKQVKVFTPKGFLEYLNLRAV